MCQVLLSLAACVCLLEAAPAPQFDPVSAAVLAAATKAIIIKGWRRDKVLVSSLNSR
jgi:hypothetical protein